MEPKKIYLSGKITGDDNYAKTFENKAAELTSRGALVFNPAVHPNMFTHGQFMELDLLALSFCNSIYMMKNWRDSKGAKMEFEEAKVLGLPVEFEEPLYAISKTVDGRTLYYSSVSRDFTTVSAEDIAVDDLFVSEKEALSVLSLSPEKLNEVHFENAEDIFCGKENSFTKLIEKESDVENIREALQKSLEENTVPLQEIELNYENWNKFFPYGFADTPVGKIKLGENQFKKLQKLDRNNLLFALNETLKNPGIVLSKETYDEVNEEFRPVEVFGKSFIREESGNKRIVESVIIFRDGEKISIGTHNKDIKRFVKQIKTADQIVYLDEKVSRLASLFYRAGGSQVQLPRDNNTAVTISDMAEQHTEIRLPQSMVNPTRESEYVKSLASNISQNESSVNKDKEIVSYNISSQEKDEIFQTLEDFCDEKFYNESLKLSHDEIINKYGDNPRAIAFIPESDCIFKGIWKGALSNKVYTGLGSFIDHWVNHHPEMDASDLVQIQNVLSEPTKRFFDEAKNAVVFDKIRDNAVHDVVILKKAADKLIYERSSYLPSKLPKRWKEISVKTGYEIEASLVDGHPTISQSENSEAGIVRNVSTLNDRFIVSQNESSVNKGSSSGVKLSKTIPHKTAIGYKVFYLKNGKLYPPMVQNPGGSDTPVGVWIEASAGNVAGYSKTGRPQIAKGGAGTHTGDGLLAYRPGWHLGTVPIARQFEKTNPENGVKELFPREFVWAECEYACDVDYQKEAMQEGMTENGAFRHSYAGLKHLPENGSYRYRTNPDPKTEEWIITGAIKVKRILSNAEVDEICRKNGREPQKRERSYEELNEIFAKYFSEEKEKFPFLKFDVDKEMLLESLESKKKISASESKALLYWWKNEKHVMSDREYSAFFEKWPQKKEDVSKSVKTVKKLEEVISR